MTTQTKGERRESKRVKEQHAMVVHNRSVKTLLAVEESKRDKPIVSVGTQFTALDSVFTVKKAVKHGKWVATDGIQTTVFSGQYILNYLVKV